jgi:hypothetical protein
VLEVLVLHVITMAKNHVKYIQAPVNLVLKLVLVILQTKILVKVLLEIIVSLMQLLILVT